MTVSAPRRRIIWAISRSVRVANESITSRAVTSMITPRERSLPTCSTMPSRSCTKSASLSADWIVAIRYWPCFRIGTCTIAPLGPGGSLVQLHDSIAQGSLGLFDASLEIADGVHLAQIHAYCDQRLGDLGRQASDDDRRAQQPGRFYGLHQVIGNGGIHHRHAGDVDDHHLSAVGSDALQELLCELARSLWIDHADNRQDEQSLTDLQHRRRQNTNGLLLLTDDALALLDESYSHSVGNAVRGGFVRIEDPVQQSEVGLVLREQRTREHVAEEQHDPNDFIGLYSSRDDAFGQVAGVCLQRLKRSALQRLNVVVVDGGCFREDLFLAHHGQQFRLGDATGPFFPELRAVLAQVRHELAQ